MKRQSGNITHKILMLLLVAASIFSFSGYAVSSNELPTSFLTELISESTPEILDVENDVESESIVNESFNNSYLKLSFDVIGKIQYVQYQCWFNQLGFARIHQNFSPLRILPADHDDPFALA